MLLRHQRQALPRLGRADQQEVIIEGRTRRARIDRHVMRRQPQRPVRAVGIMQQGKVQTLGGRPQALAPSQQRRTRHRHQHRRHQPYRAQAGIAPEPVPQRHVHAVATQIHHRRRGLDPQLDTWMSRAKTRQPGTSHDAAKDAIVLTVTVCRDGARASMSTAASICENACRSSGCAAAPSAVSRKPWRSRVNSATPSRSSSKRTCWLTAPASHARPRRPP